jgi:hypothetical protein
MWSLYLFKQTIFSIVFILSRNRTVISTGAKNNGFYIAETWTIKIGWIKKVLSIWLTLIRL